MNAEIENTGWLSHVFAAGILAAVVALAYGACLTAMVGYADDYWLLWQWRDDSSRVLEIWNRAGRFVTAGLFPLLWGDAEEVGDLRQPRLAAIAGIYLLSLGIYATMRRMEYPWRTSLAMAGLTTLLPTFGVYAVWATCSGHVFGCLAALGAFAIADLGWRERPWYLVAGLGAAGIVVEAIALCIYQPAGMFYVVVCMIALASRPMAAWSTSASIRVAAHAVVFVAALAAAFVVFRASAGQAEGIDLTERAEVTTDLYHKIGRFVAQPVSQSCLPFWFTNHWSNETRVAIGAVVLALLVPLGTLLWLEGCIANRLLRAMGLLLLVPLSYLPNLMVASDFFPYRTRAAIAPAVLLLLVLATCGGLRWSLPNDARRRNASWVALAAVFCLALTFARQHVTSGFVVPSQIEWAVVRSEVLRESRREPHPKQVVFLMADSSRPLTARFVYDEFGYVSSSHEWTCRGMTGLAVADVAPQSLEAFGRAPFVQMKFGEAAPTAGKIAWVIDARRINDLAPLPEGSP